MFASSLFMYEWPKGSSTVSFRNALENVASVHGEKAAKLLKSYLLQKIATLPTSH